MSMYTEMLPGRDGNSSVLLDVMLCFVFSQYFTFHSGINSTHKLYSGNKDNTLLKMMSYFGILVVKADVWLIYMTNI